jgi:hypothetical protein
VEAAELAEWDWAAKLYRGRYEARGAFGRAWDRLWREGDYSYARKLEVNAAARRKAIEDAAPGESVLATPVAGGGGLIVSAETDVPLTSGKKQPLFDRPAYVTGAQAKAMSTAATLDAMRSSVSAAIVGAVTKDDLATQAAAVVEAPVMALAGAKMAANQLQAELQNRIAAYSASGGTSSVRINLQSSARPASSGRAAEPQPRAYSTAFEMQLPPEEFGQSREVHFNRANAALDRAMMADSEFAKTMEDLIPGCGASVCTFGGRRTPIGWTWEHASSSTADGRQGIMRLVPTSQHSPGSPFWRVLHPDEGAAGGYSEWAVPAGAPSN